MEWEFSPADVLRGHTHYGLADFRRDLAQELRMNLPGADEPELERLFRIAYDLHYWLATGNAYAEFEADFSQQPEELPLLRALHRHGAGNVEMLGAILQRLIMDGVSAGLPLPQALEQAAQAHHLSAATSPLTDLAAH